MSKESFFQGAELRKRAQRLRIGGSHLPDGVPSHFIQMSVPIGNEKALKVFLFCTKMVALPNGDTSQCNFALRKDKFKEKNIEILQNHRCQCSQMEMFMEKALKKERPHPISRYPPLIENIAFFASNCNVSIRAITSHSFKKVLKSAIILGQEHTTEPIKNLVPPTSRKL
jgi:hypothetical protein